MDTGRRALLDRLWSEGRVFDAAQPDRLDRRRNLEPESAELLALLVRTAGADRVLELGTSNGYSTIWLADAVEPDGRVTTVDLDPGRAAEATASLAAAGVSDVVEQLVADAGQVLADQADASWPLIFLDAERASTPPTGPTSCGRSPPAGCSLSTTASRTPTRWPTSAPSSTPSRACAVRSFRSAPVFCSSARTAELRRRGISYESHFGMHGVILSS